MTYDGIDLKEFLVNADLAKKGFRER